MDPVRIKLYGLFPVTRRGYVLQLAVAAGLLATLASFQFVLPPMPTPPEGKEYRPGVGLVVGLVNHSLWVALLLGSLFALEALIVLRRFARAEEAQRQQTATNAPVAPSEPTG
jgi:hypothetical protein